MAAGVLSLKWNNHKSTFFHVLSSARIKEIYCDVTLACEGRFYSLHKFVLSTCSEYFEEIFARTQCKHPVIVLKDIKCEEIEALLNYMYIGEVNVEQEKLSGLIKAAECLKIKGLAAPDEDPRNTTEKDYVESNCNKRILREFDSGAKVKRRRVYDVDAGEEDSSIYSFRGDKSTLQTNIRHEELNESHHTTYEVPDGSWTSKENLGENQIMGGIKVESLGGVSVEGAESALDATDLPEDVSMPLDGSVCDEEPIDQNTTDAAGSFKQESAPFWDGTTEEVADSALVQEFAGEHKEQPLVTYYEDQSGVAVMTSTTNPSNLQPLLPESHSTTASSVLPGSDPSLSTITQTSPDARKTYHCNFCHYKTLLYSSFQLHVRTHTGERPYACPHCTYRAAQKGVLQRHLLTHTQEKPYTCPHCPYRSNTKFACTKHVMAKHKHAINSLT